MINQLALVLHVHIHNHGGFNDRYRSHLFILHVKWHHVVESPSNSWGWQLGEAAALDGIHGRRVVQSRVALIWYLWTVEIDPIWYPPITRKNYLRSSAMNLIAGYAEVARLYQCAGVDEKMTPPR